MKIPAALFVVFDLEGHLYATFQTSSAASAFAQSHSAVVRRYNRTDDHVWHWAKKGTYSTCPQASTGGTSTDTYVKRVNCLRCMRTRAYKTALKASRTQDVR